jgi:hypothetical protein
VNQGFIVPERYYCSHLSPCWLFFFFFLSLLLMLSSLNMRLLYLYLLLCLRWCGQALAWNHVAKGALEETLASRDFVLVACKSNLRDARPMHVH